MKETRQTQKPDKKSFRAAVIGIAALIAVLVLADMFFPGFPEYIKEALFRKNFRIGVFSLIIALLTAECVYLFYLKKGELISYKAVTCILLVSVFIGGAMIISDDEDDVNDDFPMFEYVRSNEGTCILDAYEKIASDNPERYDSVYTQLLYLHYFDDKHLVVSSDMVDKDILLSQIAFMTPQIRADVSEELSGDISEAQIEELVSRCHYIKKDGRYFIIDKTWRKASEIYGIHNRYADCFVSDVLYRDLLTGEAERDYSGGGDWMSATSYMEPFAHYYQLLIVMVLFALGWLLMTIVFKGERPVLCAFAAFPAGAAMAVVVGLIMIMLGLPFRRIVLIAAAVLLFVILGLSVKRRQVDINTERTVIVFMAAAAVAMLLIWGKTAVFSPSDSVFKTLYGVLLAEYNLSRTEIGAFIAFGYMEPVIHAMAWKFGVDYLSSLYVLMGISTLGMLAAAIVGLFPNTKREPLFLIVIVSLCFLVSNNDFIVCTTWVMSNGAVATYTLLLIVSVLFAEKNDGYMLSLPIILSCVMLITTRVEGACFALLILVLALGLGWFRRQYWSTLPVTGLITIVWSVYNLLTNNSNDEYWSRGKAYLLLFAGIVFIAAALVFRVNIQPVRYLLRYIYPVVSVMIVAVMLFCTVYNGDFGAQTFQVYARDFATAVLCNAAGMWCCILFAVPLLIKYRTKKTAFSLVLIASYLLLIVSVLPFRDRDDLIHIHMGDSARRMLQQLYPAALLLIGGRVAELPQLQKEITDEAK